MSINLQTSIFAQTGRPKPASDFARVKDVERA
jgi:hypothetical protein